MQKKWCKTPTLSPQTTFIAIFIVTSAVIFPGFSNGNRDQSGYSDCSSKFFNCGDWFKDLSFPFWGDSRPSYCGHPSFGLHCNETSNTTIITIMSIEYRVIDYNSRILTIAALDFAAQEICPTEYRDTVLDIQWFNYTPADNITTLFYDCSDQTRRHDLLNEFGCDYNGTRRIGHLDFMIEDQYKSLYASTCKKVTVPILQERIGSLYNGSSNVSEVINGGFDVVYEISSRDQETCDACVRTGGACGYDSSSFICYCEHGNHSADCYALIPPSPPSPVSSYGPPAAPPAKPGNKLWLKLVIGFGAATIGILSITSISIIIWCRCVGKVSHNDEKVEALIKQHGSLALKRYRYSDIKKMTSSLKEKLGQGGYGGVYKGKLPDGRLVAVKVLHCSKGNGEEFINEVASISKTSHVNVVNLFGFCFEGHKRALIYEFMPNGSLDKFKDDKNLGMERIYQIVCGIARGLEYLHHGCNTRILHLDIKPHNILLDDSFCPKIADFGLAKLCSTKDTKVSSMLCARGTVGYIAPEVFNRGFGRVSHKSDIYSYGMMILEIVGGRQNIVDGVTESSEMYFPDCFYKHLDQAQNEFTLEGIVMNEMESQIARKMILVGLWCIQTDPTHRPSIGEVIDMLEGSVDALQIPPRPVLSLPPRPYEDAIPSSYSTTLSMSEP